jgi:hypothetical protein
MTRARAVPSIQEAKRADARKDQHGEQNDDYDELSPRQTINARHFHGAAQWHAAQRKRTRGSISVRVNARRGRQNSKYPDESEKNFHHYEG